MAIGWLSDEKERFHDNLLIYKQLCGGIFLYIKKIDYQ